MKKLDPAGPSKIHDGRFALSFQPLAQFDPLALVEKYALGGRAAATAVNAAPKKDLVRIPAEIVADQAVSILKADQLFLVGRALETAAYYAELPPFDRLTVSTKSMLGALLDYASIDRECFANSWDSPDSASAPPPQKAAEPTPKDGPPAASLFDEDRK